ncbi:MAG: carbohydrate binding family 9 domain-containing protein, partial [Acidobacteria bacterium]|nr:carbohydrate binding family 9 domain-containing protein [Acidobacteriota bacterium]
MVRPALVACALVLVLVQSVASVPLVSAQSPVPAITRGDDGATTVRAVRVDTPLSIDGVLAEPLYETVSPMTGFIQVEPDPGALASERTETWLAFDADNVYVAFRVWDTQMDRLVATEMRRDNGNIWSGNDIVVFVFDTFNDRRSSISFTVNALGGRSDGQVINERQFNPDWNPVWTLKTGRFDGGWTLEAALPFKSLRYAPGTEQVWGFNAMRVKRSKNEISTL